MTARQFPKVYPTCYLHSFFFFSLMGPVSGSHWQGDPPSSAKKIRIEFRHIYHLTLSHLSFDRALSRALPETVWPLERSRRRASTPRRVSMVAAVRPHGRRPLCFALDAGATAAPPPGQSSTFSPPPRVGKGSQSPKKRRKGCFRTQHVSYPSQRAP